MACSTWKYQVFFLFCLILHSQLPFPSSLSSSFSSMPACSALLHFNKSFSLDKSASDSQTSYPKTAGWREDKHCCTWDGVECDINTSHVVGLDLSSSWLMGHIHSNSALFFLPNLRRLNLADNWFNDSLIPSEFGNFKSLTHLNLSFSVFSGQIPFEISLLSSLVSLDLSKNGLLIKVPVWTRVISNLTQLREFILDSTNMFSIRPNSLMNLSSSLTTLSLHDCQLQGKLENNILYLPSIQTLDLSYNWLLIIVPVWKSAIGNLTQLRELILDSTNMSSIRPNSLMNLSSSLTTISLRYCELQGKLENKILCLPNIQTLDLMGNSNLEGSLLKSNWSCNSLKFLGLSGRMFSREFLNSIGNLKSLKHLALPDCNFTGPIPAWLGNLTKLTYLDLSSNSFSGLLPSSLFNLPNLSILNLGYNQLVGPLPSHVSGLNLVDLYLSSNFLNGTLPPWLFNLQSLVTLNLYGNQFIGEIGEFNSNSLQNLYLSYNKLQGSIPRSISRLVNLTSLYLSSNNLVSINNNFAYAPPNLLELNLSSSNISEFPIFLRLTTNLQSLDLSNNKIYGRVPKWLGNVEMNSLYYVDLRGNLLQGPFPTLNFLSLNFMFFSNNKFTGEIPSLICNAIYLEVLDFSHNNLSGTIPKCLVNSTALSVLDLRMNSLHGTIPTTFAIRNNFRTINLNDNQLEGPLPPSLANCKDLEVLDLGNNKINGTFPYWLGSLQKLQVLVIRSNRFQGCIGNPKTKFPFPNLRIIDISNNQFNGPLPIKYFKYLKAMKNVEESEVALKYMGENYYQDSLNIMMKGQYIEMERVLTILTSIDFSNNSFKGEMPKIIGKLKSLKGLNFSYNNLIGYIPSSFGNLTNLEWLDLSFNKLGGGIPSQLADLTSLEVLNLSHNQLTGHIPSGNQFNTFNNDSYANNLGLCGFPLSRTCNNHEAKQPPPPTLQQDENLKHENGFVWQVVSIGYTCGTIFGMFMGYLMFKIRKPKWLVRKVKLEEHIMLRRLKKNAHKRGGRR